MGKQPFLNVSPDEVVIVKSVDIEGFLLSKPFQQVSIREGQRKALCVRTGGDCLNETVWKKCVENSIHFFLIGG